MQQMKPKLSYNNEGLMLESKYNTSNHYLQCDPIIAFN